jgi:NADH-quinone oxidoreductase subunit J
MNPMFHLLAAMTLAGAIAAMTLRNPVHCALSLVVTFAGLAGIYLGLGAQFLGLAQVLVYIGAVAILLLFVLLVTRSGAAGEHERERGGEHSWTAWGVALLAGGLLTVAVWTAKDLPQRAASELRTVRQLGESLMTDFVLPLQVVGVLLTAAMIGAAIIALRERKPRDGVGGEVRR